MSKVRLFFPKEQISGTITISDRDILHKANDVLALNKGEQIYVFDGQGNEYRYKIIEASRRQIYLKKETLERSVKEPAEKITLAVTLFDEGRFEMILQKCVELGVWSFQPFISQRSLQKAPSANKKERWKRIIQEAARQSDNLFLPQINETIDFDTLLTQDFTLKIAAAINGERINSIAKEKCRKVMVAIGPKGDFSPEEYRKFKAHGFLFLKLSKNLLRVETAAIFAVGLINYVLLDTDDHR